MRRDEILCAISDFEAQKKEAQGQVESLDEVIKVLNDRLAEMSMPTEPVIKKADLIAEIESRIMDVEDRETQFEKVAYGILDHLLDWVKQK